MAVNWDQVREQLASSLASTKDALQFSSERARQVMDRRAKEVARARTVEHGETFRVVTFSLARERYAIELRYVQRVIAMKTFAPVPGTPDFVFGVTNLRGEILAVVDLRNIFGIEERGLTDQYRIVVLGEQHAELGLLAEGADEVSRIRMVDLSGETALRGRSRAWVRGVTQEGLIVLAGDRLLNDKELYVGGYRDNED